MQLVALRSVVATTRDRTMRATRPLLRWARTREGVRFLALLAAALLLRLVIAPLVIITGDIAAYGRWGDLALHHFFEVYSVGASNPDWVYWPGYEPLAFYVFGLLEGVYFGAAHLIGLYPSHDVSSHPLRLLLKLPAICADLGIVCFIYVLARRVMTPTRALLASATYAFTPGILIVTLLWGQTDGFVLLMIALGLYFAYRRQGIWAGIMLALAIGFKPQPAIFVPLGLVYLYRWAGLRRVSRWRSGCPTCSRHA
jgi:dolichyl-phosphate-mannose-protein mannosyltransferase